ncbi:MAG: OmpA family protein [Bacteroidota bacterium]
MRKLFILSFLFALCTPLLSQDGLPEKPEDGKCYAKCVTPDEYADSLVRIVTQPAYKELKVIPAEYKTVTDTIVIRPASKEYTYVPASYRTVKDTFIIKESYNRLAIVPEAFRTSNEIVMLKPAIGRWEMGAKLPDCDSSNPEDCRTMCYREYPAVTTSVATKVLDKNQTTESNRIRAEVQIVSREEEVSPARYEEKLIPARIKTYTHQVLIKDETTEEVEIAAKYAEVTVQRLVKKGGLTYWKQVECSLPAVGEILPINYELGSAALTTSSRKIIDEKLYQFLLEHPESKIELSSHTDSRGSASNNLALSKRRAQSVVNYLVNKGISRNRLVASGKGETQLLNRCVDGVNCSETEHRLNRRTTFRILNY